MSAPTRLLALANQYVSTAAAIALPPGGTAQIVPTLADVNSNIVQPTGSFTYVSNNLPFATVDANGVVTAVAVGSATVTVSYNGLTVDVAVTVTESPLGVVSFFKNPGFYVVAPRPVGQ